MFNLMHYGSDEKCALKDIGEILYKLYQDNEQSSLAGFTIDEIAYLIRNNRQYAEDRVRTLFRRGLIDVIPDTEKYSITEKGLEGVRMNLLFDEWNDTRRKEYFISAQMWNIIITASFAAIGIIISLYTLMK